MNLGQLRHIPISSLSKLFKIRVRNFYLIEKGTLSYYIFIAGVLLAYYSSLHINPLWGVENIAMLLSMFLFVGAMLVSNSMSAPIFNRRDFLLPLLSCAILLLYMTTLKSAPLPAYVLAVSQLVAFFAFFRLDVSLHQKAVRAICISMGVLLSVSISAYVLHIVGFQLPSRNVNYNELYYFTSYTFFLVDDRALFLFFYRFHSIFLEPGHMGTAIVLLLATQIGKWLKWYNIVMFIALVISFSLAAYSLFVILIFLRLWIERKSILPKIISMIAVIAVAVVVATSYNQGDNPIYELIISRLEVNEEGDDIEGNNRTSMSFDAEYEDFIHSSDIFFGRTMDKTESGNAGYKVFVYDYGIIGFVLCYAFYFISMYRVPDKRAFVSMMILSLANFWIRAYPLWFSFYIPYYVFSYLDIKKSPKERQADES